MLNSFTFRVISSILIGVLFLQSISCASGYRSLKLRAQQLKPGDAAEGLLYYYMRGLTGECKLILTLEEPGTGGQKILEVPVVF
jgi:hypothetical protein